MDDAARHSLEAVEVARALMRKANPSAEDIRLSATTSIVRGTVQAMTGSLAEGLEGIGDASAYKQQIRNGDMRVQGAPQSRDRLWQAR